MVNALFCLVSYKLKNFDIMQIIGSFLLLVGAVFIDFFINQSNVITLFDNFIYIDALSSINLVLIATVGFTASIYSVGYMTELAHDIISLKIRVLLLFFSFVYSQYVVGDDL